MNNFHRLFLLVPVIGGKVIPGAQDVSNFLVVTLERVRVASGPFDHQVNYLIKSQVHFPHEYRCALLILRAGSPMDTLNDLNRAKAGELRAHRRMTKPFVSL